MHHNLIDTGSDQRGSGRGVECCQSAGESAQPPADLRLARHRIGLRLGLVGQRRLDSGEALAQQPTLSLQGCQARPQLTFRAREGLVQEEIQYPMDLPLDPGQAASEVNARRLRL